MIVSQRLVLRRWKPDDAEALFRYASDDRVSRLALWPTHTSVRMSREVIEDVFMPNDNCFAMTLKDSDEPIGCIGLVPAGCEHFATQTSEREIGYWIGYPHWNRGLTTEALKVFIDYCFRSLGLTSLLITTDSRNMASARVALKCGFAHVGDFTFDNINSMAFRLDNGY